jgi:hypothetical protein
VGLSLQISMEPASLSPTLFEYHKAHEILLHGYFRRTSAKLPLAFETRRNIEPLHCPSLVL